MLRLSLKIKFVLLITIFVIGIGSIILLYFNTSKIVNQELNQARAKEFPSYSTASDIETKFAEIDHLLTDSALTGENQLLEWAIISGEELKRRLREFKNDYSSLYEKKIHFIETDFDAYFIASKEQVYLLTHSDIEVLSREDDFKVLTKKVTKLREKNYDNLDWLVKEANNMVLGSLDSTSKVVRLQLQRSLAIGFTTFIVLSLLLYFLSRRIIGPINILSKMTARVAGGDFEAHQDKPLSGSDEIGELSRSFENMRHQLKETTVTKAYLDNIIHSMGDSLIVLNNDFSIVEVNQSAIELLECTQEDIIGKNMDDFFLDDIFIEGSSSLDQINNGEYRKKEKMIITRKGRKIPVIFSATVLKKRVSTRRGFVCAVHDITELKHAEADLEKYAEELERSNNDLEQFAYIASHDLQEPLRMVSSYTQLLSRRYKEKLDSDADEFINYAVDGASRMQQLIDDLLTYSRVGTRGKPFEPIDCERVLDHVLANLKISIQETGCSVTLDPLPTVVADSGQLVQLFQNLIGNAIKFCKDVKPEIHIGTVFDQDKKEWIFSVKDNGIGIEPDFYDRIFVIFQRLHTKEEYKGTGIGLAVCSKIVERHGGRIWVESEMGEGTTFYFSLPERKEKD